jgi:N-methylhydantoinase A
MQRVPGYDFERLRPGNVVEGPAIVWSSITTLVVPAGHRARVDENRSLVVTAS